MALDQPYRDRPTDADTFGAAAVAEVSRMAPRFLLTKRAFRDSILDVRTRTEEYARALHVIERRDVVLRTAPAYGKGRAGLSEIPDPRPVDPWGVDGTALANERVLCSCPQCAGTKDVLCAACGGSSRVRCVGCGGSGRVAGQRGPKNCPTCRGAGDQRCPYCKRGYVTCPTCTGSGRVYSWLEVVASRHATVVLRPFCAVANAHRNACDARDFDSPPAAWPSVLRSDTGPLVPPVDLAPELHTALDPRTDRPVSVRVQTFDGMASSIRFATAFGESTVTVAGDRYAIDPSSDWRPLSLRRAAMLGAAGLALLGSFLCYAGYANRAPFFTEYGHGVVVWLASLAAGLATAWLFGVLLLRRSARRGSRTGIPSGVTACAIVLTLASFAYGRPTRADAMKALAHGDRHRADEEARALRDLAIDDAGGKEVLDALHLSDVKDAKTAAERATLVRTDWYTTPARTAAVAALREEATKEASAALAAHDDAKLDAVARLLDGVADDDAGTDHARAALIRVTSDLSRDDLEAAISELSSIDSKILPAQELDAAKSEVVRAIASRIKALASEGASHESGAQRVSDVERALTLSRSFTALTGSASTPSVSDLQPLLATANAAAASDAAAEAKQQAVAEARRRQAEARQKAQDAAEAAREHEAFRSLLCCDGSESPSCLCHAASHQGCCSHHHGVCGCAP